MRAGSLGTSPFLSFQAATVHAQELTRWNGEDRYTGPNSQNGQSHNTEAVGLLEDQRRIPPGVRTTDISWGSDV